MGSASSKQYEIKLKEQASKIDELITINQNLQRHLLEMQQKVLSNLVKYNTDTASDITNLKANLDLRFSKLEKTVEKINSLTMKESLKEPIINESKKKIKSHLYLEDNEHNENNFTLSLNFEKEDLKIPSEKNELNHVSQWNQLLNEEKLILKI